MIAEHAIVAGLERGDSGLLTVAGLQPGNRPPPLAAGGAQDVERGVITLGDIAALGGIDRRRRDQRAREEIDQRAMARQRRKKLDKKRWTLGLARQLVVEAARFVEAVAHLAKNARAPPARREPTQSPEHG